MQAQVSAAGEHLERYHGQSRIETAIAVSQETFDDANTVVLAREDVYADALSGGPLAADAGGPILLTPSGGLDGDVADEIQRLGAQDAYVLGGTGAMSEQVVDDVQALGVAVERLGGDSRFHTARLVAAELGSSRAYVTEGIHSDPSRGWPDAVSVSTLAAHQGRPMLLVTRDTLPPATAQAIDDLGISEVTIVGGTAAVSESVADDVTARGVSVDRISGASRYLTSAAVAEAGEDAGLGSGRTWYVTGQNWPDSLVAGPAAASRGESLLLVHGASLDASPPAKQWAGARRGGDGVIVGGTAAVAGQVADDLDDMLGGAVGPIADIVDIDGLPHAVDADGRTVPLDELDPATGEPLSAASAPAGETAEATDYAAAALPDRVDLTDQQTDVRNQGGRGTCVAHAVLAAMEARYKRQGIDVDLSEQLGHHMAKMAGINNGGTQRSDTDLRESGIGPIGGFDIYTVLHRMEHYRVPEESDRSYITWGDYGNTNQAGDDPRIGWRDDTATQRTVDELNLPHDPVSYDIPGAFRYAPMPADALAAGQYGVESWTKAPSGSLDDVEYYKQQLNAGNEVLIGLTMCDDDDDDDIRDTSDDCDGGHAVLIVGYDETSSDPDDHHFIVKNSWGGGARSFEKWSYDYTSQIYNAATLDAVHDPDDTPDAPRQTILGDWDVEIDGRRGELSVYRLPGIQSPSGLEHTDGSNPSEDLRVGTLYYNGQAYRVNGEVAGSGDVTLWVDLDLGDGVITRNLPFDSREGAELTTTLRADADGLGTIDANELIGGTVSSETGETLGWYGSKDGLLDGDAVADDLTGPQAFTGVWDVTSPYADEDGRLGPPEQVTIHQVSSDDTLEATFTDASGVRHEIDGQLTPGEGRIDLDFDSVNDFTGYLHGRRPGTVSGTFTHHGGISDGDSPMVMTRSEDEIPDEVEIVAPEDGASYQSGATIMLEADVGPGEPTSPVRWWASPDKDRTLGVGESTAAKLGPGTHVILVEHGSATDTVEIVVTDDGVPEAEITSPDDGSFHNALGSGSVDYDLSVTGQAPDPEDGTLSGDDLVWQYREEGTSDWRDPGVSGQQATLSLRDRHCGATSYEIRLVATDSDGHTSYDRITVAIETVGC